MKALVLWEPWATLMRLGLKTVETRSWPTSYRGELAICAAKREPDWRWLELATAKGFFGSWEPLKNRDWFHPGCVLCVVELFEYFDIRQSELLREERLADAGIGEREELFGNYGFGRYGWKTRNLAPLRKPVPVVGRQGLFNLPPDVEMKVRAQL